MRNLLTVATALLIIISGCTPVISEQSRKLINSDASFKAVKETPDLFIGKTMLLGGRIAGIRNSSDGAQVEIVQFELNSQGYPEDSFLSYGRFLATDNIYMDPLIYRPGMLITLVGEIKGKKILRLEDMDYTYPLITAREWHVWAGSGSDRNCSSYPASLPAYNPNTVGYGFEPFLQRSTNPVYIPR